MVSKTPFESPVRSTVKGSIAAHLRRFGELGLLPRTLQLDRLDDGDGIEETLTKHKASWHPSCRARYNTTKLKTAEKRPIESDISKHDSSSEKRTRAQTDISDFHRQETCFFCNFSSRSASTKSRSCS